jgi:regulation of enolase protein 1 (concanavalin A-like superfamily)
MRKAFLLIGAIIVSAALCAQQITGSVQDAQGKGVADATVSLLNAKDSSVAKLGITKADGIFSIMGAKAGKYFLSTSHVGHKQAVSAPFDFDGSNSIQIPVLQLEKISGELKGVTVTAKKPIVEVKADKTILNVEGTINATGNDALELLRKSPGVVVDKDDNITLAGKNGVQVFIDGKPSPLTGTDLSNYLRSLQSSQIEAIELITNPSAKYEAAGTAGIINIRLKKNKAYGVNGSVNAGWNIGTYAKYNNGASLNYRYKKLNIFGNYNYNKSKNENTFNLFRTTSVDSSFDQRSLMTNRSENHGFKTGIDFYATRRSTFGFMLNGNISDNSNTNNNRTNIAYIPSKTVDRLLIANNTSSGKRDNINFNTNYRFADTSGHELNVDLDYGFFNSDNVQYQPNNMYDASGSNFKYSDIFEMITPSEIDIYSAKVDYEQNYKKGKLGVGGKISYVETDNTFQRFYGQAPGRIEDNSNNFKYTEQINALYVNYNRQFKSVMLQAGLRVENTHSEGRSTGFKYDYNTGSNVAIDSLLDRNYTNPFPSAALTFNKNPMKQWSLTYSRRIERPNYQNLNPFEFNLDKYTFQRGNPNLKPQYTNSFGITNVYKFKLNTTLNYSRVNDVFAIIPKNDGVKGFITSENVARQDIISFNVSMPVQYKWYSLFFNINSYYAHYKGQAADYNLDVSFFSLTAFAQQTFKLGKSTTAELSGFYSAPSVWQGAFRTKQLGGLDLGLQQNLLKGKATVKASVTDIFRTMPWYATNNTTGQTVRANGGWESRQFRLNLNYRFGSTQVKQARQRKTSLEEESKRTQGGGGIGQ